MSPALPRRPKTIPRWVEPVLFVLACIVVGRAIVQQNVPGIDLHAYAHGRAAMPFQARYLFVPIFRWAEASDRYQKGSKHFVNSMHDPLELLLQFVNASCVLLVAFLATRLRRDFDEPLIFPWLSRWLTLWVLSITYVVKYESRIFLPYDLPATLLFTIGLVSVLEDRALLFLVTIAVGSYNRETIVFLIPIWVVLRFKTYNASALAVPMIALALWISIRLEIRRWLGDQPWGVYAAWKINRTMLLPHHLPTVLSVGGFLAVPLFFGRHWLRSNRARLLWVGCIPFLAAAVLMGWWTETRIFGEISALFGATAAAEFENFVSRNGLSRSAE